LEKSPFLLIGIGTLFWLVGSFGVMFLPEILYKSPEEIKYMDMGESETIFGEISGIPHEYDQDGYDNESDMWLWKHFKYTFKGGGSFYSPEKLDVRKGGTYIIEIEYKEAKPGTPEGPVLKGTEKDSVSTPFFYRLIGTISILIVAVLWVKVIIEIRKGRDLKRIRDIWTKDRKRHWVEPTNLNKRLPPTLRRKR